MFRIEHNVETNKVIEIPLTDAEIADVQARQKAGNERIAQQAIEQAEAEAAKAAAQAKLAALGLTTDDLKALGL